MSDPTRLRIDLYEGPNVLAPFAAVVAEFHSPFTSALPYAKIDGFLRHFLPPALMQHVALPLPEVAFETVAAAVANALQNCYGPTDFDVRAERTADGGCRLLLGVVDAAAATLALQAGLDLAAAMFGQAAGRRFDGQALSGRIQLAAALIRARHPDPLARMLIRVARRRGIPVCPVSPGSRVWLFGQGRAGAHFFEAASHHDGMTGSRLARNKVASNQLITRLGFPGVTHGIADSPEAAKRIAREIGFPVVVKPAASGKGAGVTAHIATEAEVAGAFAEARRAGDGDVLVERHVMGDDHRLAVFGGKLAWATRRSPPRVTGDGVHTVAELIDIENRRRAASPVAAISSAKIVVDAEVRALLAAQGVRLSDRPAAGVTVLLRRIANVARGGTLADCTAGIHPDNRDMAETIARSFHLDAMGIDFMTPDISRSWRDIGCAVLEVNATPGFSSEERAETILQARFPAGCDGRIPSIVLVGADATAVERLTSAVRSSGKRVGFTDSGQTSVAGRPRLKGPAPLPERVAALVLDASCEALVIAVTPGEIERHGFPLARCDIAAIAEGARISGALAGLIESCAAAVRHGVGDGDILQV